MNYEAWARQIVEDINEAAARFREFTESIERWKLKRRKEARWRRFFSIGRRS